MNRIQCRNCECSQVNAPNCRRCGRTLPGYRAPDPEPEHEPAHAVQTAQQTVVVAEGLQTLDEIERAIITARVEYFRGSLLRAALSLGIGRSTIYRKMTAYQCQNGTELSESACNQNATMPR